MSSELQGEIYKITNIKNGKVYIGQAIINPEKSYNRTGSYYRFKNHISYALSYRDDCPKLCNAIRKYKPESFEMKLVVVCDASLLDLWESLYIEQYDSIRLGYNILSGGQHRRNHCPKELSQYLSDAIHKAHDDNPEYGDKMSEIVTERWKDANYKKDLLSKINSDENVKKMENGKHIKTLPSGIFELKEGPKVVGYRAQIEIKGRKYTKSFESLSYTLDEKLELAKKALAKLKETYKDSLKNFVSYELPDNISYVRRNGIIVGYKTSMSYKGRTWSKAIMTNKLSMEEKFKMISEYREKFWKEREALVNATQSN